MAGSFGARAGFLLAAQARAQSKKPLPRLFDIEKIVDGVYGAIARGRTILNSNAIIFENARDLLIVDSQAAPSAVYALLAQIRREVTTKPVRYIAATHLHGDHTQGLPAYRHVSPPASIVTSTSTWSRLATTGATRLKSATEDRSGGATGPHDRRSSGDSRQGVRDPRVLSRLGHTAGDLFVYCPEAKTIATGDMLHSFSRISETATRASGLRRCDW